MSTIAVGALYWRPPEKRFDVYPSLSPVSCGPSGKSVHINSLDVGVCGTNTHADMLYKHLHVQVYVKSFHFSNSSKRVIYFCFLVFFSSLRCLKVHYVFFWDIFRKKKSSLADQCINKLSNRLDTLTKQPDPKGQHNFILVLLWRTLASS